jgi:alpha-tubulin suppressor-like RCC1 family protein
VVLDNGQVHYFGNRKLWSKDRCDKEQSGSFTVPGHKIQSIALGYDHGVMVTMRGAVFGFGYNDDDQLGVVDPIAYRVTRFPRPPRCLHGFGDSSQGNS